MKYTALLIGKNELICLYRYGKLFANGPQIAFDGDIEKLKKDTKKATNLFKQCNALDYSLDAYIIVIESEKVIKGKEFNIQNIISIHALDLTSYNIGLDLSPAVSVREPLWLHAFSNFQVELAIKDAEFGIESVSKVFYVDMNFTDKKFVTKKDKKELQNDIVYDEPMAGKHSIWYYLLRYERHQNYPKDFRGYILDAIHAYVNFEKQKYIDKPISASQLGYEIMQQNENMKYLDVVGLIEKLVSKNEKIKEIQKVHKQYIEIAVFFLMLKNCFTDGFVNGRSYQGKTLEEFAKVVVKSYDSVIVQRSLYLLGITLGREFTYKYMYCFSKLSILK